MSPIIDPATGLPAGDQEHAKARKRAAIMDSKDAARQALAVEDPGWWSDMRPDGLKVVDGHFWKLTHIGKDDIRLTYHGPCSRNKKKGDSPC